MKNKTSEEQPNCEKNIEIGKRVKTVRTSNDRTQARFAEDIGVSSDLIKGVESGKKALTLQNAFCIAERYNVSLDWLLARNVNASSIYYALNGRLKILSKRTPIGSGACFQDGEEHLALEIDAHLLDYLIGISSAQKEHLLPQLVMERTEQAKREYNITLEKEEPYYACKFRLHDPDSKVLEMLDDDGTVKSRHFVNF